MTGAGRATQAHPNPGVVEAAEAERCAAAVVRSPDNTVAAAAEAAPGAVEAEVATPAAVVAASFAGLAGRLKVDFGVDPKPGHRRLQPAAAP